LIADRADIGQQDIGQKKSKDPTWELMMTISAEQSE